MDVYFNSKMQELAQTLTNGYYFVSFNKNNKQAVHRLVAFTYIPNPNPTIDIVINHIDEK